MSGVGDLQRNWDAFADTDGMWAVLTDPAREGGTWDRDAFLETGKEEIGTVFDYLSAVGLAVPNGPALDFGCGAGRLTRALAERCGGAVGVDVSSKMVALAQELNADRPEAYFVHNPASDLTCLGEQRFAVVYSSIVLQHIPPDLARDYIGEFERVLAPSGLAIFQLPDRRVGQPDDAPSLATRLRKRVALRSRLRRQNRHDGPEMEMHGIAEDQVRETVARAGGEVIDVALTNSTDLDFNGRLRYLEAEPEEGWVSKQYIVRRA